MRCPRCGHDSPGTPAFCSACGAQLAGPVGPAQPGYPPPGYPPSGYPPPGSPWQSVRTAMVLVFAGLLAVTAVDLLYGALSTAAIVKLRSGGDGSERIVENLELYAKLFPALSVAGMVVILVGAIGLLRTPPPSSAPLLAVFALVGIALGLVLEGGPWLIAVIDDKAKILRDIEIKPVWMASNLATALIMSMLALAILAASKRAGAPVPVVLVVIALVLAGLCLLFFSYLILAQPRWSFQVKHPWAWWAIRTLPPIARSVLVALLAMLLAGRLRTVAFAPRPPA